MTSEDNSAKKAVACDNYGNKANSYNTNSGKVHVVTIQTGPKQTHDKPKQSVQPKGGCYAANGRGSPPCPKVSALSDKAPPVLDRRRASFHDTEPDGTKVSMRC